MKIAVIPARGGSKRIPRKNIREFAGKPMIAHSIECALRADVFDRVIVSTDDEEIAAISRDCGAETPFLRPASIADDHAGVTAVVAHAIDSLGGRQAGISSACCIYATAPFMRPADIGKGLALLESGRWSYVVAATTYGFPVMRSFLVDPAGRLSMLFPEHLGTRSQDLPEALHDAGQFCWGTADAWLHATPAFGADSTVVVIPRWRVQDIDTPEDWRRAELMHAALDLVPSAQGQDD